MFLGTIVDITTRAEVYHGVDGKGARPIITVQVRGSTFPDTIPPDALQSDLCKLVEQKDEDGEIMRKARKEAQEMVDNSITLGYCTTPHYECEMIQ